MATDVRALLAAERANRRIAHPYLTYTKSGVLLCNVCNLNVKSETLWEGHLKSANHRKNAAAAASKPGTDNGLGVKGTKRKIEDVEEVERQDESYGEESDGRKKARSRPESLNVRFEEDKEQETEQEASLIDELAQPSPAQPSPAQQDSIDTTTSTSPQEWLSTPQNVSTPSGPPAPPPTGPAAEIDEDEWAAFENEIAPLAQEQQQPDYSAATIVAAPVSAAQAEAETDEKRRALNTEADDEKEEEERRLEEEFEVLEEMEEKVRRLKEKREALRTGALGNVADDSVELEKNGVQVVEFGDLVGEPPQSGNDMEHKVEEMDEDGDDDDDDDDDDWYR